MMNAGVAVEDKREASTDGGENSDVMPSAPASLPDEMDEERENEIMRSMMSRIRVLKMIVKGGIDVPDNRRKAMKHDMWPEFYDAEKEK